MSRVWPASALTIVAAALAGAVISGLPDVPERDVVVEPVMIDSAGDAATDDGTSRP